MRAYVGSAQVGKGKNALNKRKYRSATRVGFLPAKTSFCQTSGKNWFLPAKTGFYRQKLAKT